ncbi:MAG: RICIN domain-containing protein [Dactylosporangium sp.]|nr:RICIN domain-containing protein [Dactylosporangium sp.]
MVAAAAAFTINFATTASAATIDAGDWYVIVNRNSGKVIDVADTSTEDGALIQQWSRNDGYWQQFRFESAGTGYWRIVARHSGKAIDLWEWNTADGAEYRQWPITSGYNQQFSVITNDDGYQRFINRHSGKALEVWEWSTADGGMISQYTDLDGANQQWQLVKVATGDSGDPGGGTSTTGLVGWATQNGGTTGGGSASTTTVSSSSALSSAVSGTSSAVVQVSGTISCSGMISVGSNKTIVGASGATIAGCGLNVSESSNVIIQNLTFRDWDDDAINLQYATNVWVDHNTFSNGYDGCVDIKRASDYVTVSWNHTYDHGKTMLLGHSDDNASEDSGHLRVTYHHNWFDGTDTRHPRVRFGDPVHVFNNYYYDNEYGVASTEGAGVLVEGNYFENVEDPTLVGYAASDDGDLVQQNNYFTGSGTPESSGSVNSIPYSYSLDTASGVKSIVTSGAGAS